MMVVLMSASLADGLRVDLARSKAGIGIVVVPQIGGENYRFQAAS